MSGKAEQEPLAVERWADRLFTQSNLVIGAFVASVMVWRVGVSEYWQPLQYEIAEAFPTPTASYRGGAVLSPALMTVLGLDDGTERGWYAIHLLATIAAIAAIGRLIWRRFATNEQRWFMIVCVAASSLPAMLLIRVGHYDLWFILGAAIVALARSLVATALGGVVLGLTNAEQAFVAIAVMLAVAALVDRAELRRVVFAAIGAVAAWAGVQAWYAANDVEQETRAGLLGENLNDALRGFVNALPFHVFSWFSAAWIAVVSLCRSGMLLAVLVVVPAVMSIITVDGTRVFVACSAPAFLLVVAHAAENLGTDLRARLTRWTLIVMCATPAVTTFVGGRVPLPWIDLT